MAKNKKFIDPEESTLEGVITMLKNRETGCMVCKHLDRSAPLLDKCKAFPDQIPDIYLLNEKVHSKPKSGQGNDIVFEHK